MKILVTRPEPDASRLGERLRAAGHDPVIEPLLSVEYLEAGAELSGDLKAAQAQAFTSANGVRALARLYSERALPVFAVGAATAAAARAEGFNSVHVAGGDVSHLADDIAARLDPSAGAIVHVAASVVAGDLQGALAAQGFKVNRHVLYETVTKEELSDDVIASLTDQTLEGVTIYSPRTGKAFAALIEQAGLTEACKGLTCYCLSANVAEAVASLPFAACFVAATPDEDALLALLPAPLNRQK